MEKTHSYICNQPTGDIIDLIILRPMKKCEENFVLNSWLKSLRAHSSYYGAIPQEIYFHAHEISIRETLSLSNCIVATPKDEPDIIIGYLVFENRSDKYVVLHYCYVKNNFRRMGLATLLVETIAGNRELLATHYTNKIHLKNLRFNPYFFRQERF